MNAWLSTLKQNRRAVLLGAVVVAMIVAVPLLTYLSYARARARAGALIATMPGRWVLLEGRFGWQNLMTSEVVPCWNFSYNIDDNQTIGENVTVQVSPFGHIFATNPAGILERDDASKASGEERVGVRRDSMKISKLCERAGACESAAPNHACPSPTHPCSTNKSRTKSKG